MIKEFQLKFEDALGDPKQCLLPLLNALDQPVGGTNFFLQILTGLLFGRSLLTRKSAIERINPQPRHTIIIEKNHVFTANFLDKHIRQYGSHLILLEPS